MGNAVHKNTYIPIFDPGARFCYFLDLIEDKPNQNPVIIKAKHATFDAAKAKLVNGAINLLSIKDSSNQADEINSAIEFLKKVAQSERNKEIRIVKKYIEDIKKDELLSTILQNNGSDLSNLLNELQEFSNNPTSNGIQDFYSKLILLLNKIKRDTEEFKNRIEQLSSNDKKEWRDLADENIIFRLSGDIDTALKGSLGIQQREGKTSLSTLIIRNINNYIKKNLRNSGAFISNPYATIVAIMVSFEAFIQKEYDNLMKIDNKKVFAAEVDRLWKEFESQEDNFLTELKNTTQYAQETLLSISKQLGFSNLLEVKDGQKAYEERLAIIEKQQKSKTRDSRNQLNKTIHDILGKNTPDIEKTFKWTVTTGKNGQHGLNYEIFEALRSHGNKIGGSPGTDVLVLDIANINMDIFDEVDVYKDTIITALEKAGTINSSRKNRFTNLRLAYEKTNKKMQSATNKLTALLQKNKIPSDIFIYHESLKLYATAEEHKGNFSGFEGRTLGILNALDSLYTANNIAGLQLVDMELLYNIVLNLSTKAVANPVQPLVEDYLSIFAGLLMFDDIQNIAQDAAKNAAAQVGKYGQALNIHMYLLNDVYVPGSYLLTVISEALAQGYSEFVSSPIARVNINTSAGDEVIEQYLNDLASGQLSYQIADWRTTGNIMAGAIKIKIIFFKSFLKFIQSLNSFMQ